MSKQTTGSMEPTIDRIIEVSEGIPGALVVLGEMKKKGRLTTAVLDMFDECKISGSRIWAIHKDICGQKFESTFMLIDQLLKSKNRPNLKWPCKMDNDEEVIVLDYISRH
jgi:hypothetical protein